MENCLRVQQTKPKNHTRRNSSSGRNKRGGVKVVYISSPMKVKTCASNFRALVQELTGKDSDAAVWFSDVDVNGGGNRTKQYYSPRRAAVDHHGVDECVPRTKSSNKESPDNESCDFAFEPLGSDALVPQIEGGFLEMFKSTLLQDPAFQLDVLRSFDAVN